MVEQREDAGEDKGVLEALACAGALVGAGGVGDVAEEAEGRVGGVVCWGCGLVVEGPAEGFCVLWWDVSESRFIDTRGKRWALERMVWIWK